MEIDEKSLLVAHEAMWMKPVMPSDAALATLRIGIEAYEAAKAQGNSPEIPGSSPATGQPVECREAFEQWSLKMGKPFESTVKARERWLAWQAAWAERQPEREACDEGFTYDRIDRPHVFLQWKGTNACFDFHCECGAHCHFDGDFAYIVHCPHCDSYWRMSFNLFPKKLADKPDPHKECIVELEPDGDMEVQGRRGTVSYPECSGDPSSCPENEGFGCCKPNPRKNPS